MFNKSSMKMILLMVLTGCSLQNKSYIAECNPNDPHSYSNFDEVVVTNINFDLYVDFNMKQISGKGVNWPGQSIYREINAFE